MFAPSVLPVDKAHASIVIVVFLRSKQKKLVIVKVMGRAKGFTYVAVNMFRARTNYVLFQVAILCLNE